MNPTPKVNDIVWFRVGRVYGFPQPAPERAMITRVHSDGLVDLEIGCKGLSRVAGTAWLVRHIDKIQPSLRDQATCWWEDDQQERTEP